jgi:hypothetical protein
MRFTTKDAVASALVVAAVVIYAAYVAFDGIPLVRDATGMAAVGLVLGFASRRIGGRHGFAHERLAFAGGLGAMALGIATLFTESDVLLAAFMASIVGLWAAAMFALGHTRPSIKRAPVAH